MAPEPEFDLATSRARVNQDPATLTRPELRYGNYLPLLGRGRKLLDGHSEEAEDMEEMMAPASYDDRPRQLLDSAAAAAAPAPTEDEEGTLELATERGRLGGRTGMNFGTGTLYTQNRFDNRRRQLLDNHAAPAPEDEAELVMSTERGRIGGRTGYNFGTGQLYTQNRFDDRR